MRRSVAFYSAKKWGAIAPPLAPLHLRPCLARKRKQSKALQPQITTETAFRRQNKTFQIKTKEGCHALELKVGHDDFGVTFAFLLFVCQQRSCLAPDDILLWELHRLKIQLSKTRCRILTSNFEIYFTFCQIVFFSYPLPVASYTWYKKRHIIFKACKVKTLREGHKF